MRTLKKKFGFTLIELLIVVAIIAILAAIAVPNMLEAQTRAKVSRSVSDMRSVDTAMKAYYSDYNRYPSFKPGSAAAQSSWIEIDFLMVERGDAGKKYPGMLLTTPVAYITSVPYDVFMTSMLRNTSWGSTSKGRRVSVVETLAGQTQDITKDGWVNQMSTALKGLFPRNFKFCFESCGPDLYWWDRNGAQSFLYDPTNGTVSYGQIVHFDTGQTYPRK